MIEIEFEKPNSKKCDCCDNEVVSLTRLVYQDNNAFAVYYIGFTRGHSQKIANGLISLGAWGEGSEPKDRIAFSFQLWNDESNYKIALVDANESPWSKVTYLGRILDRSEALTHEWIKDMYHITDHIITEDTIVIDYFTNK